MSNIMSFALPYMLAYLLQILYGLADLFVIGQYCDVSATTAVANAAQVMYMLTVIIIGLAMGSTVCIGRAVGASDERRMARVVGNTITMFLTLGVVLAAVLLFLRHDIVALIDTPSEAVEGAVAYLTITFAGIPFIVAYNVIASIFRGMGDSRTPMYFVGIACVLNVSLDFLLIGHFGMGPGGAAVATTLSQAASVAIAVMVMSRHKGMLGISRADLKPDGRTMRNILKIGFPVAMQDGLIQVAFIIITVIANQRGLADSAAVGIVEKFIGLLFIVPSAMLSTVSAVSAQNIGAGKMQRAQKTLWRAVAITFSYGLLCAIVLQFVPDKAVSIFTNDAQVITLGGQYLKGYAWDCALAGIHFCFSGFFTACGLSVISFGHNFLSIVCVRVPLSWLGSVNYPDTLFPMGLASPAGSLLSVIICLSVYLWLRKHKRLGV